MLARATPAELARIPRIRAEFRPGRLLAFELERRGYAARGWVLPGSSASVLHGRWPSCGVAGGGLAARDARAAGAPRDRGGMGAIVMAGDPGFWDVAWNWPLPFVAALAVLAVPMAGIIWFICQLRYKQQIARLKNRVELADERLG